MRLRIVWSRVVALALGITAVAVLMLPEPVAKVSRTPAARKHRVEAGETVWGLAKARSSTSDPRPYVDEVLRLNGLESPRLLPGQTLVLPAGS